MNIYPLVTVITPTYNRAGDYLRETIESVLSQDYPKLEYIVLDDGSTDHTRELLKEYDGRIIWESHPNMGVVSTVNKGFAMAKGDYIVVCNSDDPYLPGYIKEAVTFMEAHPDVLAAYPDWVMIDEHSNPIEEVLLPEYDFGLMIRDHFCIPSAGTLLRRKAIELTGVYDTNLKYIFDFDFYLRLGLHGKLAHIPKVLATYRSHGSTLTNSQKGLVMAQEHVKIIKDLYQHPNIPTEIKELRSKAMRQAYYASAVILEQSGDPEAARPYYLNSILSDLPGYMKLSLHERVNLAKAGLPPVVFKVIRNIARIIRPFKRSFSREKTSAL